MFHHLAIAIRFARLSNISDDEIVAALHAILDGKHPELKTLGELVEGEL